MDSAFIINCLETNNLDLIDADPVKMCRTCAVSDKDDDFRNIFESTAVLKSDSGKIHTINEVIDMLTQSVVLPDDGLPQKICRSCIKQLYTAFNFLSQAMKIQRAYQKYLQANTEPSSLAKDEMVLEEMSPDGEEEEGTDEDDNNISVPIEEIVTPSDPATTQVFVIQELPPSQRELVDLSFCESSPSPAKRTATASATERRSPKKTKLRLVPTKSLTKVDNENGQEREFECNVCHKKYSFIQSLNRHMHGSHGSKDSRKECSYCKKTFSRADDLTRHIRTHTNERPYACNVCQKTFKQSSELKEHMQTHTKETIFKCTRCSRKFTSRMGLYTHSKTHAGNGGDRARGRARI